MRRATVLLWIFASLYLNACIPSSPGKTDLSNGNGTANNASQCDDISDCGPGEVCVSGNCANLCAAASDCAPGQCCTDGACQACDGTGTGTGSGGGTGGDGSGDGGQTSPQPPVIDSVNGSGSIDATIGHAERHLTDRIVVKGAYLTDAVASLDDGNGGSMPLESCGTALFDQREFLLPSDIAPGTYTLTVTNEAGSCNAGLSLLQGEPGSLNASGNELVIAINNALAADPQLSIAGTVPTNDKISALTAVADATSAGGRSIVFNGEEQVNDTADGIFLAVFDLVTHTAYDHAVGVSLSTRMLFAAGDAAAPTKIQDVLATLSPDHVIVLASGGNVASLVQALGQNGSVAGLLRGFGASDALFTMGAGDAYVLIGSKGIGEGNGLEQVAGNSRNGLASISTVAIGPSVTGMLNHAPTSITDSRYVNAGEADAIDSSMIIDGTLTNVDIAAAAGIDPSKISGIAWTAANDGPGSGLDADKVDGKSLGQAVYRCPASCSQSGWCSPCSTVGAIYSSSGSISCTGAQYYDSCSGGCAGAATASCSCTLVGYILGQ